MGNNMHATDDSGLSPLTSDEVALAVLVVDDSAVNRELALSLLDRLGCAATVAANGAEALTALTRADHALVLMDLWMPELDGLDCARAIREVEAGTGRHTPIVAVTSREADEDLFACLEAGIDDHVVKPLSLAALERVLRRWAPYALHPMGRTAAPEQETEPQQAPVAPVDVAALARLRDDLGGDWETVVSLVATYLAELEARLRALRVAVDENDISNVRLAAHTLATTSALIGATSLADTCRDLEMSTAVDVERTGAACAAAEAAAVEVRSALRQLAR